MSRSVLPIALAYRTPLHLESGPSSGEREQAEHIIRTRLSRDARVRCVSISCRVPRNNISDRAYCLPRESVHLDEIAWQPLADVLAEIQPLSEMEWEDDKLPFCILQSLNSQHLGCRLRMLGVNCITRLDIDDIDDTDERPARRFPSMYELLLPLQDDYVCRDRLEMNVAGSRGNEIHQLAVVGRLSTSLTHLKHPNTYPRQHDRVRLETSSEYVLIPRYSGNINGPRTRYRAAALSSLDLISKGSRELKRKIRHADMMMWNILTHLPALHTFKSKLEMDRSALKWLTAKGVLGSLKTLDIAIDHESASRDFGVLVKFLRSLPSSKNLAPTGEIHPPRCHEWISFHASSVKRLRLMMLRPGDNTFNVTSLSALLGTPLPLLEHLSITIKRFRGNSRDVGMYKILGSMPRLQSIELGLDCSLSPDHPERDFHHIDPDIVDALDNSAVDEKLAVAIFRAISAAKSNRSLPLERLEVHPHGGYGWNICHFYSYWSDVVGDNIEHSWLVKRRYPGLGLDELSVHQIQI